MLKQSLIFTTLLFISSSLFSELTNKKIANIFEYSNNIKQTFIQEELSNIEVFLEKSETVKLLFTKQKLNKLYEDKWTLEEKQNNIAWHSQVFELFCSHELINYNGSSTKGRNFVLMSQKLFPSYLVKIPKCHLSQKESEPFYYQNISRILYNKLIYEQINKYKLKHIYPIKKCLVHIPTRPQTLSDQNYAVVAEKITSVYKFDDKKKFFQKLLKQAQNNNRQALGLIAEIVFLIKKVGLWDIDPRNIFFVENYKVAFVDTEKWWYEESDEKFFRQDEAELKKLASHGITLLSKILCGVPDLVETEEDKIRQKKAIILKDQLLLLNGYENLVKE
jgi:hypothetical protein